MGLKGSRPAASLDIAVCGVSEQRLDHSKRIVEFAREMLQILARFDRENGMNVTVRMALNAGPVTGGVIGREKFSYELFGETTDCARAMLLGSEVHAVLVSQSVYDSVQDLYSFYGPFQVGEGGEMVAWALQTGAIAPAHRNAGTDPRTMENIPSEPDKAGPGADAASRPPA